MQARRAFRRSGRQLDVADWFKQHLPQIKDLRAQHCKEEPGVFTYAKWGLDFVKDTRAARSARKKAQAAEKSASAAATAAAGTSVTPAADHAIDGLDSPINQHMRSMELTRRFKWKRVTWDKGADFDAFSNRMMNSNVANQVPAFSFLCMHLVRDRVSSGATADKKADAAASRRPPKLSSASVHLKTGDITNWYFVESDESNINSSNNSPTIILSSSAAAAAAATPAPEGKSTTSTNTTTTTASSSSSSNEVNDEDAVAVLLKRRAESTPLRAPFRVDWDAGEVFILDTASPSEVHSFLRGPATSLQSLQSRRADEETQLTTDLENARLMMGSFKILVNEFDRASYSDPERRANPRYVDPADVKRFCASVARNSIVMRHYLKDQHVRILARGSAYRIDPQTREVCVPADFEEYHTASIHGLARPLQAIVVFYRRTCYLWLLALLLLFGDTEFI